MLQKRISGLEAENATLRKEVIRIADETQDCEEHEARLVNDLVSQLEECRAALGSAGIEGERIRQHEMEYKEQLDHMQAKLQATDEKLQKVSLVYSLKTKCVPSFKLVSCWQNVVM
jgi:predicted  nucleic acid-binding Zn-ribbon protein